MNGVAVRPFNVLELCAGVGGLGLGIHIAVPSARSVAFVEREAYAAATLVARMAAGDLPEAAVWSDLATFDGRSWRGVVDCVASGDPCQPNSVAGKRTGAADDRFLIDQVLRIVDESRPFRLFRENVTGNADGQLAALVGPLEAMGYRVAAGIFSAAEVGASHRRDRLFIMADAPDDHGRPGNRAAQAGTRPVGVGGGRPAVGGACGELVDAASERRGEGRPEHELRSGWHTAADSGSGLADAGGAGREGCEFRRACDDDRDRAAASGPASELCGTLLLAPGPGDARWAEILAGSPGLEPAICRMADGLAHRVDRLRAGGNGVVSLAAARAWLALDALHADARTAAGVAAVKAAA
jgi:DNA (cytosine-5)-methyltransferase 1